MSTSSAEGRPPEGEAPPPTAGAHVEPERGEASRDERSSDDAPRDGALRAAGERLAEAAAPEEGAGGGGAAPDRRRLLLAVAALAIVGLAAALWQRERASAPPIVEGVGPAPRHVVFADVEGWYRQTPSEVALATPVDWSLEALPGALPLELGPWAGGEREHDPAVDEWFRDPPVSVERTYRREDGELVWLSAFGHRGKRSYHLFEHTPDTCYPLGGWAIERFAPRRLALGDGPRPLTVNHGVARRADGRQLVFLYLYLWDAPGRDPERGVLSLRLAAPVSATPEATLAMLERDFLPQLFVTTLPWRRF